MKLIDKRIAVVLLWLFLTKCMDLHYDYHVSDHFCGIANNIASTDFELHPTTSSVLIRIALHILPLSFALAIILLSDPAVRMVNFGLSLVYVAFHCAHFMSQFSQDPPVILQISLLAVSAAGSLAQVYSYQWMREG